MKKRLNHLLGGTLLISGTTIGVAMLAVPTTTAFMGLAPSLLLFFICWIFMLGSAFFLIDVNCVFKKETDLISMAQSTIGSFGKWTAWLFYLLLLYALLVSYIMASSEFINQTVSTAVGFAVPQLASQLALPALFSLFIYLGISGVDRFNRLLMFGLLVSYIALIAFVPMQIKPSLLMHVDFSMFLFPLPVVITSFGYHIIIPSLAKYANYDVKDMKLMAFWGSLMTVAVYGIWQLLVLGVVPLEGQISLASAYQSASETAVTPLAKLLSSSWLKGAAESFSIFAIITSFLGVALSLAHFLKDGLGLRKHSQGTLMALLLTFTPPLLFANMSSKGFILALNYAGVFVAILLIILPALMAWNLPNSPYRRSVFKVLWFVFTIIFGATIVVTNILNQCGVFQQGINQYVNQEVKGVSTQKSVQSNR